MARLEGFEPPTARFVAEYSIQLSYRRIIFRYAARDALSRFMMIASMLMVEKEVLTTLSPLCLNLGIIQAFLPSPLRAIRKLREC